MDKLKMMSMDNTQENIKKIQSMFPNAVTEVKRNGRVQLAVDFDVLKQEMSTVLINDNEERYQMTWPDKKKAILNSNSSIRKTLRPCKDESVDFDNTANLYIEGDNLDVLKLLQETYLNKVKLIYIDPPYNAGEDLLYKNKYEISEEEFKKLNKDINEDGFIMSLNNNSNGRYHTDWINMMYSRIKIARDLLSNDGCIVISIDHNELINLIKIGDEIFSESNRIGIVTVVHKPEGRNQEKYFATSNEFVVLYAKNKEAFNFEKIIIDNSIKETFNLLDKKGAYKLVSLIAKNHGRNGFDNNLKINNPNKAFPIYVNDNLSDISLDYKENYIAIYPNTQTQERTWKYIKETCAKKIIDNEIVAQKDYSGKIQLFEKYREDKGQLIKTHWIDIKYNAMVYGTKLLDDIMKTKTFDFPKSLFLMKDIVNLTTNKQSLILDFFSGSGTTAHAVMQLNAEDGGNRKFIMVQLPEVCDEKSEAYKAGYKNICEIGKERIRRAGNKIKQQVEEENKKKSADELMKLIANAKNEEEKAKIQNNYLKKYPDIGFRVLKLDSSNMKDVYYKPNEYTQSLLSSLEDNIKEDRTPLDLLFQVMLDLGKPLSAKIETVEFAPAKQYFNVDDGDLICCFDINLTEEEMIKLAKLKPLYFVTRDCSALTDNYLVNFDQYFATYSPNTVRKII